MENKLNLNIQLFAEEADNDIDFADDEVSFDDNSEDELIIEDSPIKADNIDKTKAFSDRLNKEREKIVAEKALEVSNRLDEVAKKRGFDSWEELERYDEEEKFKELGVTNTEELEKIITEKISKHPSIIKAEEVIKREEEARQAEIFNKELKMISDINPDIKTIDDLVKMENYDQFYDKVANKGYSYYDAFVLVNIEKIKEMTDESARKKALNNLDGKSHLKTIAGGVGKEVYVSSDEMETLRKNFPGKTDSELKEMYKRYNK